MKLALVAASLVLVAGGAVGCGDDGGSGGGGDDTTSTSDFCGALKDFQDDFSDADPTKDLSGYIKSLKPAADKLQKVGTPDGMPSDAKDGFDLTIKTINAQLRGRASAASTTANMAAKGWIDTRGRLN